MTRGAHAQLCIKISKTYRYLIKIATPADLQHLLNLGAMISVYHKALHIQNYSTTAALELQGDYDKAISNLCIHNDACPLMFNTILALCLLRLAGKRKSGEAVDSDVRAILNVLRKELGQVDMVGVAYDNPEGSKASNNRIVKTIAETKLGITVPDLHLLRQLDDALKFELHLTVHQSAMPVLCSTDYAHGVYDPRIKNERVTTSHVDMQQSVTHMETLFSESFKANYSPERIGTMDASVCAILCPLLGLDDEVHPVISTFGRKKTMDPTAYEMVRQQRLKNLEKGRATIATALAKRFTNENRTPKEQGIIDKMEANWDKNSAMWWKYNNGKALLPDEEAIILSHPRKAWKLNNDGRQDEMDEWQRKTVKAQRKGGESKSAKKVAAVKANGSKKRDAEQVRLKREGEAGRLDVDKIICRQCSVYDRYVEVKSTHQLPRGKHRSTIAAPLTENANYPLPRESRHGYRCGTCGGEKQTQWKMSNVFHRKRR